MGVADWNRQSMKKGAACPSGPSGKIPGYADGGFVPPARAAGPSAAPRPYTMTGPGLRGSGPSTGMPAARMGRTGGYGGRPAYADGGYVNPATNGAVGDANYRYRKNLDDAEEAMVKGKPAPQPSDQSNDRAQSNVKRGDDNRRDLSLWDRAKSVFGFADGGAVDFSDPMYADNSAGAFGPMGQRALQAESERRAAADALPAESAPGPTASDMRATQAADESFSRSNADIDTPTSASVSVEPAPKASAPKRSAAPAPRKAVDTGDETSRLKARFGTAKADSKPESDVRAPVTDTGDETSRLKARFGNPGAAKFNEDVAAVKRFFSSKSKKAASTPPVEEAPASRSKSGRTIAQREIGAEFNPYNRFR